MNIVLFEEPAKKEFNGTWKTAVRECIESAVYDKTVQVIVSPDVDGILSFYVVREYFESKGIHVDLVGQYDSREIKLYFQEKVNLDQALYLDLDVRFAKHVIGQHYLGDVVVPEKTYFNPNLFFGIKTVYTSKYPFGTAHLLLWSLFPSETLRTTTFPILKNRFSLARCLIVHADSTYSNCHHYHRNAMEWSRRLFGDIDEAPLTLRMLLDGTYRSHCLLVHKHMLRTIQPYVHGPVQKHPVQKKQSQVEWKHFGGHQTCTSIDSVFQLLRVCEHHFRTPQHAIPKCTPSVFWKGELDRVKYHVVGENIEGFLQKQNVQSHAIVNMRTISVTFGSRPY